MSVTLDFAAQAHAAGKRPDSPPVRFLGRVRTLPFASKPLVELQIHEAQAVLEAFGGNYPNASSFMREVLPELNPHTRAVVEAMLEQMRTRWQAVSLSGAEKRQEQREKNHILQAVERYCKAYPMSTKRRSDLRLAARYLQAHARGDAVDWDALARAIAQERTPLRTHELLQTARRIWRVILKRGDAIPAKATNPRKPAPAKPATRQAILQALSAPSHARAIFELGKVAPDWTERHFETIVAFLKALEEVNHDA